VTVISIRAKRHTNCGAGSIRGEQPVESLKADLPPVMPVHSRCESGERQRAPTARSWSLRACERLASLMIQYGVGARSCSSYTIHSVDEDYFSEV
jgi:hypothetical protein